MKVIKADTAGFCFGVAGAVEKAFRLASEGGEKIYTFGPLIHNSSVVRRLEAMGVQVVDTIEDRRLKQASVIIRAHGVAPDIIEQLQAKGCRITDATCPFVRKIHSLVRTEYAKGKQILIIGDPKHPEVQGINGHCGNSALILESEEDADHLSETLERDTEISVVTQTTFNIKKFERISEKLKKAFDKLKFFDTICSATALRQKEAEKIAAQVDLMIIVGGRNSSNTLKLYDGAVSYAAMLSWWSLLKSWIGIGLKIFQRRV